MATCLGRYAWVGGNDYDCRAGRGLSTTDGIFQRVEIGDLFRNRTKTRRMGTEVDGRQSLVPRIRHYLTDDLKLPQATMIGWIQHWLGAGLSAMETLLAEHQEGGKFCHGDQPSFADIGLVTQVTPAKTFDTALDAYPRVMRIYDACMAIPAFADAAPAKQPDAE